MAHSSSWKSSSTSSWKSSASTENSAGSSYNPAVGSGRSTKSHGIPAYNSPGGSYFSACSSNSSTSPGTSYNSPSSSYNSPSSSYNSPGTSYNSAGSSFGSPGSAGGCAVKDHPGCSLCYQNKETKAIYMSHSIKDSSGNVTCPILYANVCPFCKATGKDAHTKNYCPKNPSPHSFKEYLKYRNASGGSYNRRKKGAF